jgi:predicted RNase H-like HicB family nuclease
MQKRQTITEKAPKCEIELKLTPEIHREGKWFVAFCPEVPEANGQGRTREECVQSLKEAVLLLMEDRRADALRKPSAAVHTLEPA